MNVAVPSAQHSLRFGQPASSHTVTSPRSRTVRFSSQHLGAVAHLRPQPLGLARADRQPAGHARLLPSAARARDPGALAAGERRQVVGPVPPGDVLALDHAVAPHVGGPPGDDVDHLGHRHVDALLGERRDRLVGDAAGHDVVAHVAHVGGDVEGEAVHRPAAARRTPMAQILRGFGPSTSTHTPGYPARRPASARPSSARVATISCSIGARRGRPAAPSRVGRTLTIG